MSSTSFKVAEAAILAVFLLVGCGREECDIVDAVSESAAANGNRQPGVYVGDRNVFVADMDDADSLVIVNGEKFTRHDFDVTTRYYEKIYLLATKKPLDVITDSARKYARNNEQKFIDGFIGRTLMRQEAERLGVAVNPVDVKEISAAALKAFNRPKGDLDAVAEEIGGEEGKLFKDMVYSDILGKSLRDVISRHGGDVSEREIDEGLERVKKLQEKCRENNRIHSAEMECIIQRARAGENFALLGQEFGKIEKDEGKFWCQLEISEIDEDFPAFRDWLATAKQGDVGGPFEWDDGMMAVKCLQVGYAEVPDGVTPPKVWDVARITVEYYDPPEDMTRQQVKEELARWKMGIIQKELGTRLFQSAVIEFPNGTNLFPVVSGTH